MKRGNMIKPLAIADEDRKDVRSDVGKKLMHGKEQITTAKQKRNKPTKRDILLENQDVRRWYDNQSRSSLVAAEVRLRKLGRFCQNNKITPIELAELGLKSPRAVADLLEDTITTMEKNGKAPQYINGMIEAVKSWLEHFDIEIRRNLKVAKQDATPNLANQQVPDAKELPEQFNRAGPRA